MSDLVLNRQQVQDVDRHAVDGYGIPGMILMENAGRGVADTLCRLGIAGPVIIVCGKGNNAGDGLVIARHLDVRRFHVKVLLCSRPQTFVGDTAMNYQILRRTNVPLVVMPDRDEPAELFQHLHGADWVVDALLGTGATGAPRPPLDSVLRQVNSAAVKRLAVDVPSGVDCDTGHVSDVAFRADHTCTFVAKKPGLLVDSAQSHVGQLHVLDIGVPRKVIDEVLADRGGGEVR